MQKKKAVVLVSGGMDSCVTSAVAAEEYELYFLHINYGQRTEDREYRAFMDLCAHFNVSAKLVVDISYLKEIGGSSLTDDDMAVEKGELEREGVPSTYVPFRNANILSIAASWAEVLRADALFIGAVEEDGSGYPDCRKSFYDAFERAIDQGTRPDTKISIETPLINLRKKDIVKLGMDLNAPLHLSWSCYKSEERACGECDSCLLRLRGFQEAGYEDPIEYAKRPG
ncbi:7-cyano-7-deazaguanine synthase QueC [Limisalsivibrio acetivorans]|uniref:7-cyano-7-deazaguanine synthase QueC n=1 Tax=Limisalsivibrio acetivorans TaxID=1304888 RepID=UPI0003B3CE54|nr:7-cyano-7-deazaguanine synthase QueC [Limisalsivibrio acetivorans]